MIDNCRLLMISLILSIAACSDDGQPRPADQLRPAGRPDPVADQNAGIYYPTTVDTKAEVVYHPPIPSDVVDLNFDGVTVIQLVVGTNGIVDTAFVERSSNRVSVDSLVLDAARKMVWTPAVHDGVPVKMRVSFPFMFRKLFPTHDEETVIEE